MIDSGFGFPYLLNDPGTGYQITGEIYEITPEIKRELDILEDVPNVFYLDDLEGYYAYFCTDKLEYYYTELLYDWKN